VCCAHLYNRDCLRIHQFSNIVVLDVDVFLPVLGHGVVSKLECSLVLIDCRSTVLVIVDIFHQLSKCTALCPARQIATYCAFVVNKATTSCCLEVQLSMTAPPLSMPTSPYCDRLAVVSPAQSKFENT
jgi:hypothetical protein